MIQETIVKKTSGTKSMLQAGRWGVILSLIFSIILSPVIAHSLPVVDETISGDVEVKHPTPTTLQINASDKAIINYKSFDIEANEAVIITLPSSESEILNRVMGESATRISGSLYCNGTLILINKKGMVFGPNSNIDAASLLASTRNILNSNFMGSKYVFEKISGEEKDGLLLHQGKITIREGGFGVLIAGAIENQGVITAPAGLIALAAGDKVSLNMSNNGYISVAVDKATAKTMCDYKGNAITSQINNTGQLRANGGAIQIKAEHLPDVFRSAVNLQGFVNADSVKEEGGRVRFASKGILMSKANLPDRPREE